jgi:DNA-binding NtrC family response regulator
MKRASSGRVLVVDDDAGLRGYLERALRSRGREVVLSLSVDEALRLVASERFEFILLDNLMPEKTGLGALPAFVAAAGAPVVLMTGQWDEELQSDALALGAKAVLRKPFTIAEVERVLAAA